MEIVNNSQPYSRSKIVGYVSGLATSNELINKGSMKDSRVRGHKRGMEVKLVPEEEVAVADDLVRVRIGSKEVLGDIEGHESPLWVRGRRNGAWPGIIGEEGVSEGESALPEGFAAEHGSPLLAHA